MNRPAPAERAGRDAPRAPRCPFCGSAEVERFSRFGSQLLTEQYYCRTCRTPFEAVRRDDDDDEDGAGAPARGGAG
jgi:ring-1,2-phenylacetyl-CoA epoxidase subunit PaaD